MSINTTSLVLLPHIQEKAANYLAWLGTAVSDDLANLSIESFPYACSTTAKGCMEEQEHVNTLHVGNPVQTEDQRPRYLALVPHLVRGESGKIPQLIERIRDEGFGRDPASSKEEGSKRLAVVIGANAMCSLDDERNAAFVDYVKSIPSVEGISSRVIGKRWKPVWVRREGTCADLYPIEKAYRIWKSLRPEAATKVVKEIEDSAAARRQVPFQHIREWVKDSAETQALAQKLFRDDSPAYLSLLDDDTVSLRAGQDGLYTLYDGLIQEVTASKGLPPQLASTGYSVPDSEFDALKFTVETDMAVRGGMAQEFPLAPYYPEPNAIVLMEEGAASLSSWSFLGKGRKLESLRLIQNGVRKGTLVESRAVFRPVKALVTTAPDRMKCQVHQKIGNLTPKKMGEKQVLESLRGSSQTHAFPKEWANRLYAALPITASTVTDATMPLLALFTAFCPKDFVVGLIKAHHGRYSCKAFPQALAFHASYVEKLRDALLQKMTYEEAKTAWLQEHESVKSPLKQSLEGMLKAGYLKGLGALSALHQLKLAREYQDRCVRVAAFSSQAIAGQLRSSSRAVAA